MITIKVWVLIMSIGVAAKGEIVSPNGMSSGTRALVMNTIVIDNLPSKEACETLAGNLVGHIYVSNKQHTCVEVEKVKP